MEESNRVDIVPAQPGWAVIGVYDELPYEQPTTYESPIVAWRLVTNLRPAGRRKENDHHYIDVQAITLEGVEKDESGEKGVLRPDGFIDQPGLQTFATKDEFLKFVIEERRKREAAAAAAMMVDR